MMQGTGFPASVDRANYTMIMAYQRIGRYLMDFQSSGDGMIFVSFRSGRMSSRARYIYPRTDTTPSSSSRLTTHPNFPNRLNQNHTRRDQTIPDTRNSNLKSTASIHRCQLKDQERYPRIQCVLAYGFGATWRKRCASNLDT